MLALAEHAEQHLAVVVRERLGVHEATGVLRRALHALEARPARRLPEGLPAVDQRDEHEHREGREQRERDAQGQTAARRATDRARLGRRHDGIPGTQRQG